MMSALVGTPVACLREETILGFAEGRLRGEELAQVEAHVRSCPLCDELLAAALTPVESAPPAAPTMLAPGTRIGRYEILGLLGVGGMSEVYAAYDPQLARKIALKLLRPPDPEEAPREPSHENRLLREAQAIARLRHPNVVAVHDVGAFGSRVFLAMEHIDGQPLSLWLLERKRPWREILAVFLDAARGLSAAHAANIVHRDFKPQNVMVGRDGLVLVTDFGLARRLDGEPDDGGWNGELVPLQGPTPADESVTSTSRIAGTPSFMAPEQFRGERADARSDQYSYCVSLYRALYGEHPFLDRAGLSRLPGGMTTTRLRPPPPGSAVPGWLRDVIARGLSARREERWRSMDELRAALQREPVRDRRQSLGAVALVLLLGAADYRIGRATQLCIAGPARLAEAWETSARVDDARSRRNRTRAAFLRTGLPEASQLWQRTSAFLDRYARRWLAADEGVCATTDAGDDQSAIAAVRAACLEDRRQALEALTSLLVVADGATAKNATHAAVTLPPLDMCDDVALLRPRVLTPPPDAPVAATAADVHRRAFVSRAMFKLGDQERAVQVGEAALAEARALKYAPLVSEILLMLGSMGNEDSIRPDSTAKLQEAARIALSVHRDDIAAEAYVLLAGIAIVFRDRPDDSRIWIDLAQALLDRLGEREGRLRSWLLQERGLELGAIGEMEQADRMFDQTLALKTKILSPDDPDILRTVVGKAENFHMMGRDGDAVELLARFDQPFRDALGPGNPLLAVISNNRGEYLIALGRAREAIPWFQAALTVWGTKSITATAYALTGLGHALLMLGRPAEARPSLERALGIRRSDELDVGLRAETAFLLAEALWATGQPAQARHLALAARDDYHGDPRHQREERAVEGWLAQHHLRHAAPRQN